MDMNPQRSVQLHIERLIVDASLLSGSSPHKLQSTIETELAHLLREQGLSGLTSGALYDLPAREMPVARGSSHTHVGRQIARTVYSAINRSPSQAASKK